MTEYDEMPVIQHKLTKPTIPFSLTKLSYNKLVKKSSITNWKIKKNKAKNNCLTVEYWTTTSNSKDQSTSIGRGINSGVKSHIAQSFVKKEFDAIAIYFDSECDSWIVKSKSEDYYRMAWPNAYRNDNYPHHETRNAVDKIISECSGLTIYT